MSRKAPSAWKISQRPPVACSDPSTTATLGWRRAVGARPSSPGRPLDHQVLPSLRASHLGVRRSPSRGARTYRRCCCRRCRPVGRARLARSAHASSSGEASTLQPVQRARSCCVMADACRAGSRHARVGGMEARPMPSRMMRLSRKTCTGRRGLARGDAATGRVGRAKPAIHRVLAAYSSSHSEILPSTGGVGVCHQRHFDRRFRAHPLRARVPYRRRQSRGQCDRRPGLLLAPCCQARRPGQKCWPLSQRQDLAAQWEMTSVLMDRHNTKLFSAEELYELQGFWTQTIERDRDADPPDGQAPYLRGDSRGASSSSAWA